MPSARQISKTKNSYESIDTASPLTSSVPPRSCNEVEGCRDSFLVSKNRAGGDSVLTLVTGRLAIAGLTLWAGVATVAAVLLAVSPRVDTRGIDDSGPRGGSSLATTPTGTSVDVSHPKAWCLPNAVRQTFSGVVLKDDDGVIPRGKWNGHHWWYHDEITNGFHILATIGGDTYGFWDLTIISSTGRTEYKAGYKRDTCLYYTENSESGGHINEEAMCRGSAWAGNVSLEGDVEYGYGTKAERWSGEIPEDHEAGNWSLPPGTESLIDFQRSQTNEGEVRLLYHRVVAPTQGVFGWVGGESLTFDLVFTGVESMADSDVLDLVKVPAVCETRAGEFHDQQARGAGRARRT